MPITTNLHLPFPDDEEWLNQGAYAIEQLCARLDSMYAPHRVTIAPAESTGTLTGAGTVVDFPGAATLDGFTYAGGVLTYTGPSARPFLIAVSAEVDAGGTNLVSVESSLAVRQSGVILQTSYEQLDSIAGASVGTIQRRKFQHNVTVPAILSPGQGVDAVAYCTSGANLGVTAVRIYPIGPAA